MASENGLDEATTSNDPPTDTNGEKSKQKEKEKPETVPFHRLFSFADSTDILLMIVGTIGAIGNGISMPLMTLLFGQMVNGFGSNQITDNIVKEVSKVSLGYVYLAIGSGLAAFLQVKCWMIAGERQAARIRGLYLKTILRQDVAFFDKETNTGEVIGRMSGDTVLIQDAMGEKGGFLLTLVMMATFPLLVVSGATMTIIIGRMASRGQTAYAKAAHVVEQTIGSIRTVASFTGEKQAVSSYNKFLEDAYKSGVHEGSIAGAGLGTVMLVVFCGYALAIWFGAKMIMEKGYDGGTVINVITAVLMASMSLGQASPSMSSFAAGQAAAFKMFETIERKPEIDAYDPNGKKLEDIQGEIELREVYFSYPARPDELIFNGFSLHIASGTTLALVGQSGSGKSTVISLVERFYDPQAGEVLIHGINLKEFQLRWIRGKIGLVSQEPVLFASRIKDNIAYGKEGATIEQIKKQLNSQMLLSSSINCHRDWTQWLVSMELSCLSERVVQDALDRIMVNRTTVAVAHRLSTVRNADMIAVIHRGKMVEKGTHSELLRDPEGAYSQLIRLQEVNKGTEETADHWKKSELSAASSRQSSQRKSLGRSISRASSLVNSIRLSFSASLRLSARVNGIDTEPKNSQAKEKSRRHICFEKVVNMELGWFDVPENSSGAIGARLSADAASVRALVGDAVGLLIGNLATVLAGLIIAFTASWELALIIPVLIPLIGLKGYAQMKFMKGFSADAKMMYEEASQVANDAVGSIRTVASFCAEDKVMELYRKKCEGPMKTGIRLGLISGSGFGVSFFLLFCVYATSFYAGARFVKAREDNIRRCFQALLLLSKAKSATASIFGIIDKKSNIDPSDESGTTLESVKGEIELRHISFKYSSRPDINIFRDLNLTIHSGKTVALVGGSGKSTVIALLQRFYDPDSGEITLDGIQIRQLQLKWLRQQMGFVSQEPVLFNETIRDNVAHGKGGNATEAEIIVAAKMANAHRFITALQQGYDTIVGERGTQLSGGQKQRVAIARAIIKSPKILLLVEATSALDAESERIVQDALDKVTVNRTTVVVAHRLSTIKNADVIAVVKNGVIVEKGRHETLINIKDGFYASLVQLHTSAATV
ncbi:hypothetical protein TanjilG_02682 [Lupinus angustifolius]|uniref:Uncharacterized protein n=1 Tax=Lupinus angustifolius TaxID=3871 RepID=A0A4P1RBE5_LUPAN|nr:hypothetical protein TanjilG_02682 [Lupinus angustifolius]